MLNDINREYWKKVSAGETTSLDIQIPNEDLKFIPAGEHILDVGCGDGKLAEWLSAKGFRVSAIDINQNAIDACKKRSSNIDYSVQDISTKTTFKDATIDFLCLKFVLTNIHRDGWPAVTKEIDRIVSPGGFVWLVEPLISDDYLKRYELAQKLLGEEHTLFVFKNPKITGSISTTVQLQNAIDRGEVSRISRHYTREEIAELFPSFKTVREEIIEVPSPSGFRINTFIGLLKKEARNMKLKSVPFEKLKVGDKILFEGQNYRISELCSRDFIVICRENGTGEILFDYDEMTDPNHHISETVGEAIYLG